MKVIANDIKNVNYKNDIQMVSFDELIRTSDVLSRSYTFKQI